MAEERDDARLPEGRLSEQDRSALLGVARLVLTEYLTTGRIPSHNTDSSALLEHRGAFVSLHRRDSRALRGCLGEFLSRRPLVESVTEMTIAAATRDPRFPAVTVEELPDLQIEISALSPLYPIPPEQVQVGVHGLMIVKGEKKGLLLPHVPLAYGWEREEFLANLCLKAGLGMDDWRSGNVELHAFETDVWEED